MSIRVMIIDGQPEFRRLLEHHVSAIWHDARFTAYDPVESGPLPEGFAGAGHDLVLLGDEAGVPDATEIIHRFTRRRDFPPLIYFSGEEGETARATAINSGASAFFRRSKIDHRALAETLTTLLSEEVPTVSTKMLFEGAVEGGRKPLLKGYRLRKKLDATEFSSVYLVEDERDGHVLALKVLRKMPDIGVGDNLLDRFIQEYELIASLDHPNIAQIENLGVSDQHAHIAMEWLSGGDLAGRIRRGLKESEAVSYLKQVADALGSLHDAGILHLDLKPANIMFRGDGSVALIDFGLARRMRRAVHLDSSGLISGTPYYMSPEQGHGDEVDRRADLYSLGIIFYEMLTGRPPFGGKRAMEIIYKHRKEPVPSLPPSLARHQPLLERLLAKSPADRPASAREVVECL